MITVITISLILKWFASPIVLAHDKVLGFFIIVGFICCLISLITDIGIVHWLIKE